MCPQVISPMHFTYDHNGHSYTVKLQWGPDGSRIVTIGERTLTVFVHDLADGGWRLTIDGDSFTAYSAADGDKRFVAINGAAYTLTTANSRTHRRSRGGSGDLTAQMPGQIIDVRVRAGDVIESGQTLVIMEAMKMEIRIVAPGTGIVKTLLVAPGDVVERGQRLLEIEPSQTAPPGHADAI